MCVTEEAQSREGGREGGGERLRRGRHKEGKPMTEWPWKKAG